LGAVSKVIFVGEVDYYRRKSVTAAIAIAAHPDDIEFAMAGTLLLLKRAGYEIHYFNLLSGNGGSAEYSGAATRRIRRQEAKRAATLLGAHWHAPIGDDLELVYSARNLRRVASVIREVRATIVLTHATQDYMEDHMTSARLAVTAAFAHGIKNFAVVPARPAYADDVTVYHAMPHGLTDWLRRHVTPGAFVNTTSVQKTKLAALAAHRSQQHWLHLSQGMNSYLQSMHDMSRAVGRMSRRFQHAEGWRRHLHYGFSRTEVDPLKDALGRDCLINKTYERGLTRQE
jgi:LmbE family N-acetylglucosaminyl deacetylase